MSELTVGQKILMLRNHHGVSQEVLRSIIKVRPDKIVNVEKGRDEYTEAQVYKIKQYFNIQGLPLSERERTVFRNKLYYMRDLIRARRMDEAKAIRDGIVNIKNLEPCDFDMVMLYKMIEAQMFIVEGLYIIAEDMLSSAEKYLLQMNPECLYHYHYNKGVLAFCLEQCNDAFVHLMEAYERLSVHENLLPKDDMRLFLNIGNCCTYLEFIHKAIFFLMRAKHMRGDDMIANIDFDIDYLLAVNYIRINELSEAEKIVKKSLVKAESRGDNSLIALCMQCYGDMNKKAGKWARAIDYYDKSLMIFEEYSDGYYRSLHRRAFCLIKSKAFSKARLAVDQANTKCDANKSWFICFKALDHHLYIASHMTLRNKESCDYLENVACPYFIENDDHLTALEHYELLDAYYERSGNRNDVLRVRKAIDAIYKRCFANRVDV